MTQRLASFAILAALLIAAPGCLFGGHSDVRREGTYVAASTMDQIKPGKTTKSWVRAVVGEPTERIHIDAGQELWKYAYTETKDSSGYVFLIFSGSDSKKTENNVFIEFEGDVVRKTWRG